LDYSQLLARRRQGFVFVDTDFSAPQHMLKFNDPSAPKRKLKPFSAKVERALDHIQKAARATSIVNAPTASQRAEITRQPFRLPNGDIYTGSLPPPRTPSIPPRATTLSSAFSSISREIMMKVRNSKRFAQLPPARLQTHAGAATPTDADVSHETSVDMG
jgi:hypothetical protein